MKTRKPRYAKYELERMTIRELKSLLPGHRRSLSTAIFSDKSDLIEFLISSGVVDLISTPPPVEFPSLAYLRAMGVGQLKRTMNDTGVYFEDKYIVEKEDLVQLFVNSGRICLTDQEPEADTVGPDTTYGHEPCARQDDNCMNDDDDEAVNDTGDKNEPQHPANKKQAENASSNNIVVETVGEYDEDDERASPRVASHANQNNLSQTTWFSSVVMESTGTDNHVSAETANENPGESDSRASTVDAQCDAKETKNSIEHVSPGHACADIGTEVSLGVRDSETESEMEPADETADDRMDMDIEYGSNPTEEMEPRVVADANSHTDPETQRKRQRSQEQNEQAVLQELAETADPSNHLQNLSISELRSLAREQGVDLSRCIERSDMVENLTPGAPREIADNTSALDPDIFQSWSVSQLLACGQAVNCDFRHGSSKEDMIEAIIEAAGQRPYVANYVKALSPLIGMNISQLRAQAREMRVNVSDCLEKGEFIRRLVAAATNRA